MAFWKVETKDGKEYKEGECDWIDIADNVAKLALCTNDGQFIFLPNNMNGYIQAKTASADLNGNNITIESRYIGCKVGNNTLRIRVDEKTNNINIEID